MTTDHRLQEQMYRDFESLPYLLSEQDNGSTRRLILWKGTELLYSVQYWPNGGSSVEDAYTIMFTYC